MTVITTSTATTATAYSNQRKIDRTSNGVLWSFPAVAPDGNSLVAYSFYSLDNGTTWTEALPRVPGNTAGGSTESYTRNHSVFIDQDDYAHIVYKANNDGYIYYRRGTPNAGRTAWTWSTAVRVSSTTVPGNIDYPDIVAFRAPGTSPQEWDAVIVWSDNYSTIDHVGYQRVHIANDGTTTLPNDSGVTTTNGAPNLSTTYGDGHLYPSIDFHHTGDGKTVAGGTPHLYVAWSAGSGKGIKFKKATYSGGTWTWGTEREIDSTRYIGSSNHWIGCLFDGTRVIIPGVVDDGTGSDLVLYERDADDTVTTALALLDNTVATNRLLRGSATYDGAGNVYLFGMDDAGAVSGMGGLAFRKWVRAAATLEAEVQVDATGLPYVSAKRGYSNNRIEFIYTDGTASPYNVTYDGIALNEPPVITVTPADGEKVDPRVNNTISWTYSDPEGDQQTSFSAVVKEPSTAPVSWSVANASKTGTINTYTVPADGVYTIEAIGAAGGQSTEGNAGGKGARVVGDFTLTAGTELKIISGQPGQKPTENTRGGGGGGASWVYLAGAGEPMLAAGGGGGGGNYAYSATVQDASTTTSGKSGSTTPSGYGAGGTGGNGGVGGTYGAGGAGWKTNGGNGYSSCTGGLTPANGGTGGNPYNTSNAEGGFGGGGGAYAGAGGGAGYSGGGAGGWSNSGHGGGGGSYNAGTNQIMEAGVGAAEGSVTISQNGEVVFSTSGTTQTSFIIPANSMSDEETYSLILTVAEANNEVTVEQDIISNSWNEEAPVVTATQSGNYDLNNISHGDAVEIQVATSDAVGFGSWSATLTYVKNNIPDVVPSEYANVFNATEGVVKWTYEDADGDPQTVYQIRVRKKI